MNIININESFRYINVVDDLIPVDKIDYQGYEFNVPTVIPVKWGIYRKISQEQYMAEFDRKHSIAFKVLQSTENVAVAGGAAARPLYILNKNVYTDIDLFIYGIFDEQEYWNKVNEIAEKIIILTIEQNSSFRITQKMKKGIVVIGVILKDQLVIEYQIILRMYHTLSSIIHAFDIPSCCVAFDGYRAYTTTLGAYAHSHQVNLVHTIYRSTSFERRLVKYFTRGFGLGLIGYNLKNGYQIVKYMDNTRTCKLNHKYLNIHVYSKNGNKIIGNVNTIYWNRAQIDNEYANIGLNIRSYHELVTHIQCIEDAGLILQQHTPVSVDYSDFYNMKVSDIIKLYPNGIERHISKQCNKIQNTRIKDLKLMAFSKTIIREIIDIILNENELLATKKIMDILYEQIQIYANYIPEWLIVQDPQRQYTAAINPVIENPENWYGTDLYNSDDANA